MTASRTHGLILVVLFLLPRSVPAQSPGLSGDPYRNILVAPGPYWYGGRSVAADLIDAQGQFLMNMEQTKLLREQVRQEKLVSRRKEVEHWAWERTFLAHAREEYKQLSHDMEVRRIVNDADQQEIYSGAALNSLRKELLSASSRLADGNSVSVNPECLEHVHITSVGGNVGLLKNDHITWPLLILGRPDFANDRAEIDQLINRCKTSVLGKQIPAAYIIELRQRVQQMENRLKAEVRADAEDSTWSPSQYNRARRALKDLKDALVILEQPDAAYYLNPLKGNTVAELMGNMRGDGVSFAPATLGDERYYSALYHALRDELKRVSAVPSIGEKP